MGLSTGMNTLERLSGILKVKKNPIYEDYLRRHV